MTCSAGLRALVAEGASVCVDCAPQAASRIAQIQKAMSVLRVFMGFLLFCLAVYERRRLLTHHEKLFLPSLSRQAFEKS
jgi:hypothetical protein